VVDDPSAERRNAQLVAELGIRRAEVAEDLEGEREDVLVARVEAALAQGAQPLDERFLGGGPAVRLGRHDDEYRAKAVHSEAARSVARPTASARGRGSGGVAPPAEPFASGGAGGEAALRPLTTKQNRSVYPTESGSEPHPNSPGSPISSRPPA
jgi:hypothetical protein